MQKAVTTACIHACTLYIAIASYTLSLTCIATCTNSGARSRYDKPMSLYSFTCHLLNLEKLYKSIILFAHASSCLPLQQVLVL